MNFLGKFNIFSRNYEAGSLSPRLQNWNVPNTSPNSSITKSLTIVRNRSRQMVRDNPYAVRAVQVIVSNTIGSGIMPRWANDDATKKKWELWQEDCDVEGRLDFVALQTLAFKTVVVSGECLILKVGDRVQVVECDHIDEQKTGRNKDKTTIRGIEFDAAGRRTGYWILPNHPSDSDAPMLSSVYYPAENVLHLFRVDRPGQVRGMPWAAPILIRAKDFDGFEDAFLLRQRLSNCFAGFIYDDSPDAEMDENAILPETLEPGTLPILPPGKRIEFTSPPPPAGYSEYIKDNLKSQAVGWGITYEAMTGDLSEVNYSSGRMGRLEMMRNVRQWQDLVIQQLCKPLLKWLNLPAATWTVPRNEIVDPSKELLPIRDAIRAGLLPPLTAIQQLGYSPTQVFDEWKEFLELQKQSGALLDSNPENDLGRINFDTEEE